MKTTLASCNGPRDSLVRNANQSVRDAISGDVENICTIHYRQMGSGG
jgi:hypothetical protein